MTADRRAAKERGPGPRRVLYVLANFPKLSESFILNEILAHQAAEVDVRVVAFGRPKERQVRPGAAGVPVRYLPRARPGQVLRNPGTLLDARRLPGPRQSALAVAVRARGIVAGLDGERWRPDVLHAHFADDPGAGALLAAGRLAVPYTVTCHSYDLFRNPSAARLTVVLQGASAVFLPSARNREHVVEEHGVRPARAHVVRACYDGALFRPGPEQERVAPTTGPLLVSTGRLVEKKGIADAVDAVGILSARWPSIRYEVVGSGPLAGDLRARAADRGIADRVRFRGDVSDAALVRILRRATAFVLPCIVDRDGDVDICPLGLQEAMACETPVIGGDVGSVRELVRDGVTGLLVPPHDPPAIANAVTRLLESPQRAARLGRAGRQWVEREFSAARNAAVQRRIWAGLRE